VKRKHKIGLGVVGAGVLGWILWAKFRKRPNISGPDWIAQTQARISQANGRLALDGTPYVPIPFEYDSAVLPQSSTGDLDAIAAYLIANPVSVEVQGHTDSVGSEDYNWSLSEQRADSVTAYLVSKGARAEDLYSLGLGESAPIASNDTDQGRATNRRVEFVVI